jgi:Tfp pilus assembly protein PilX
MGLSPQRELNERIASALARPARRRGVALLTTVIALLAAVLLIAGLFTVVDLQFKAESNRADAARATMLAEASLSHGITVLRNSLRSSSLNALLTAQGISGIPSTGVSLAGGRYFLTIRDDPADATPNDLTDSNQRIMLVCTGRTARGSEATINYVVTRTTTTLPGMVMGGGTFEISAKPTFTGACGSVHTNGSFSGGGEPSASGQWTTTGSSVPSKFGGTKLTRQAAVTVPVLDPVAKCPAGATQLSSTSSSVSASSLVSGRTYCKAGNLEVTGDLSSERTVSIIVTGSIKIPGKPRFKAHHPEGIVVLAGGDLDIQGESILTGLVYCGGQIYISNKLTLNGALLCANLSPHPGSNWVDKNLISGDATFNFTCDASPLWGGSTLNQVAWYSSIGT